MAKADVKEVAPNLLPFQFLNEETGEVESKYKYLEGQARQYRFDAKDGEFNLYGEEKLGPSLKLQPIAWRTFQDAILGMETTRWVELFFVDEDNCISAVLFHGYSYDAFMRMLEPMFYKGLALNQVIITVTAIRKETVKNGQKAVYHIADFKTKIADPKRVDEYLSLVQHVPVYRLDTITGKAIKEVKGYYALGISLSSVVPALQGDENLPFGEGGVALPPPAVAANNNSEVDSQGMPWDNRN